KLKDLGPTFIVVAHDEDTIESAAWIVDIGPGAGEHGGEVVYAGPVSGLMDASGSITGDYLAGRCEIQIPPARRHVDRDRMVTVKKAVENILRDVTVSGPLRLLTVVTGVSCSGKSTLFNEILYTQMANVLNGASRVPGRHKRVTGL